jgi:uncharacterized membrane protein
MSFAGACIRAWFVARHKPAGRSGFAAALPAVLGVVTLGAVVLALAPPLSVAPAGAGGAGGSGAAGAGARGASPGGVRGAGPAVDGAQVQLIIDQRCVPCHSVSPTEPGFSAPPNGVVLQSLDQVLAHLPQVQQQLALRTMPLGNLTKMTDDERATVLMWIGHGMSR